MLPPRAYAEPVSPFSTGTRPAPSTSDARATLVVAAAAADLEQFPTTAFAPIGARNTLDALRLIERWKPRVVAIDWDSPDFDSLSICAGARQSPGTGILALTVSPERAPQALHAGCHAILLKPFAPNLLVARIGRLARELPTGPAASRLAGTLAQSGINRAWPEVACPTCSRSGAVSFEHSSHRRDWYACLACHAVWEGRRQE